MTLLVDSWEVAFPQPIDGKRTNPDLEDAISGEHLAIFHLLQR